MGGGVCWVEFGGVMFVGRIGGGRIGVGRSGWGGIVFVGEFLDFFFVYLV